MVDNSRIDRQRSWQRHLGLMDDDIQLGSTPLIPLILHKSISIELLWLDHEGVFRKGN